MIIKFAQKVSDSEMSNFFSLSKDAQGFPARRTAVRRNRKTRGGRRSAEKGPFLDGH